MHWIRANNLRLSPNKTDIQSVGGASVQRSDGLPALEVLSLALKDKVHSLGVFLDLSFVSGGFRRMEYFL